MTTFTRTSAGTYDGATGTWSNPTTTTITGSAIQVRGTPQRYEALELVLSTMPTLFFTPDTYPLKANTEEFVLAGDTVLWNNVTYTVKDVDPIAPDGYVIASRIIVAT